MDHMTLINQPKTARGKDTLNRILSAATQLFCEIGYHNTSVNDIARRAGVASGTFYIYFESKYNLYRFLLFQHNRMIRKHLHQATEHCRDRREIERTGMRAWLEFVQEHRYIYHIIWESLYVDKQLFVEYYTDFSKAYVLGIERSKQMGELRSDLDSGVLAWTLMGASNFLGLNWGVFTERAVDINRIVDSFMDIITGNVFAKNSWIPNGGTTPAIQIQVDYNDEPEEEEISDDIG